LDWVLRFALPLEPARVFSIVGLLAPRLVDENVLARLFIMPPPPPRPAANAGATMNALSASVVRKVCRMVDALHQLHCMEAVPQHSLVEASGSEAAKPECSA
jgi:hypothetical protein